MNTAATLANAAWIASSVPAWRRFRSALHHPARAQAGVLAACLERNARSSAGHVLGFDAMLQASRRSIDPPRELLDLYRARVPLTTYTELEPYIERIRCGEQNVLTAGVVRRLIPSSGSTSAIKFIPFTEDFQGDFNRAVLPWIADLHFSHPRATFGRSYWSISPATARDVSGAVPVGFENDSEYLGRTARALARAVLVAPDEIGRVTDADAFRYVTLVFLAAARDLRVISVWHPSFLTRLLDALPEWLPRIADDIASGTLHAPGYIEPRAHARLERRLRPDGRRARELGRLRRLEPQDVWPDLTVISCWTDGAARAQSELLASRLCGATIQGKGLIATEGVVSIPFAGRRPLAVRSHFFEFIGRDRRPYLAHELEQGHEYSVVLTTGGGLYRYELGDRVVVDGTIARTPSIGFVGREDRISDLFGEKLSDGFVAGVIDRLFAGRPAPRFAMLAPLAEQDGFAYGLFVESDDIRADLAGCLEGELQRNIHYAWCVRLRQLRPARVVRVGPHADRAYVDACMARGRRLGDIKPAALDSGTDWERVFRARSRLGSRPHGGPAGIH